MPVSMTHTTYKFDREGNYTVDTLHIPVEQSVMLMVNGKNWLTFMCTPDQLEALGIGFLFNEGVIRSMDEVEHYRVCEQKIIDIWLNHPAEKPDRWIRTSGCAGGKTVYSSNTQMKPIISKASITPGAVLNGIQQLLDSQKLYRLSRGVHGSALGDGHRLHFISEDIGRHNTFDKLVGQYLLSSANIQDPLFFTSGRISSEMMLKSYQIGSPIIISISSPTSRSIELANSLGIMLIGYARRNSFNVYAHSQRLILQDNQQAPATPSQSSRQEVRQK